MMENHILPPLLPDAFIQKLKVDNVSVKKDYLKLFENQIKQSIRFSTGPYFWFIPDNTQSRITAVSDNVSTQTPYSLDEWLNADIHFFTNLIHPDDRYYLLSSIQ